MKLVALISGGKDSCYNMILCQKYGHEIVALANLMPAQQETDELDSWMYQTVGHQMVGAYAECMGLPLYRRRITGSSADQRLVYEDTEGDEVEDLACLLAFVKKAHPQVTAVSSGAIASDYQRTRVERVCARLGLVSLAYLWHQPQAALLRRMIDAEVDAILVKVAAAGLTPRKHLGARLATLPAQLHALRRQYGCNVCGEGGEYESLTLDCPLFTRGRISLDSWQTVTVSDDRMAPVALLHPTAFHVVPKGAAPAGPTAGSGSSSSQAQDSSGGNGESGGNGASGGSPPSSTSAGAAVTEMPVDWVLPTAEHPAAAGAAAGEAAGAAAAATPSQQPGQQLDADLDVHLSVVEGQQYCSLTASVAAPAGNCPGSSPGSSSSDLCSSAAGTAAALAAALERLTGALPALGLDWRASLFVHLYVPDMSQFAAANAAYAAVLPAINPPSRATIQLCSSRSGSSGGGGSKGEASSSNGLALVVEVLFARRAEGRRVLHVQSISEWAPSCIGPYSQATRHAGLVLFAGQIALDPPTMGIVDGGIDAQCARCLLSCQRVAVAMRTDLPQSLLWCTVYCSEAAGAEGRRRAATHLAAFLQGQVDTSALEQQERQAGEGNVSGIDGGLGASEETVGEAGPEEEAGGGEETDGEAEEEEGEGKEEDEELVLDDYLQPPAMQRHWQPLLTFVTVPALPRGVLVEVQPVACVVDESMGQGSSSDEDDSDAVAAARRERRSAAAVRPAGSTMPGWIGRVHSRLSGSGAMLWSPGRLCKVHAWVHLPPHTDEREEEEAAGAEAAMAALEGGWREAMGGAAAELAAGLAAAELAPADVAACKVYCLASLLASQQQQHGLSVEALREAVAGALPGVCPAVVPVSAVGGNSEAGAALLLELLAVRS